MDKLFSEMVKFNSNINEVKQKNEQCSDSEDSSEQGSEFDSDSSCEDMIQLLKIDEVQLQYFKIQPSCPLKLAIMKRNMDESTSPRVEHLASRQVALNQRVFRKDI